LPKSLARKNRGDQSHTKPHAGLEIGGNTTDGFFGGIAPPDAIGFRRTQALGGSMYSQASRSFGGCSLLFRGDDRMADKTLMTPRNALLTEVSHNLRDDIGGFAHDVLTLAELQSELFVTEVQEHGRRAAFPTLLLLSGVTLGVACCPIALVAFALMLVQATGLSHASAFSITAISGVILSSLISIIGCILIRSRVSTPSRSREELARNLNWMKTVLSKGADPSRHPKKRPTPTAFSNGSDPS
jgi:hypothetical protein